MRKLKVLFGLSLIGVLFFSGVALVKAEPYGTTVTVDQALVDKLGGITVSGTADCSAAVKAYYGDQNLPVPQNLTVQVNINWTAYQPVGRNKTVAATFYSNHLIPCYNSYNFPNPNYPPVCGGDKPPCRWITSNYNSTLTPFYAYSLNGKFAPGPVHIDFWNGSEYIMQDGVFLGGQEDDGLIDTFIFTGFNLRATRVR